MSLEIERKYLVEGESWRASGTGTVYRQGYLSTVPERSVRVRVAGDKAYLTVKGAAAGAARAEYEYAIPVKDAREMLDNLCERPLIEKTRYQVEYRGLMWEIDEFTGENAGLLLAEVELESENQAVELPDWVGAEVTGDPRYYNASLVSRPYSSWDRDDSRMS
jgi:adenylate cyclase